MFRKFLLALLLLTVGMVAQVPAASAQGIGYSPPVYKKSSETVFCVPSGVLPWAYAWIRPFRLSSCSTGRERDCVRAAIPIPLTENRQGWRCGAASLRPHEDWCFTSQNGSRRHIVVRVVGNTVYFSR